LHRSAWHDALPERGAGSDFADRGPRERLQSGDVRVTDLALLDSLWKDLRRDGRRVRPGGADDRARAGAASSAVPASGRALDPSQPPRLPARWRLRGGGDVASEQSARGAADISFSDVPAVLPGRHLQPHQGASLVPCALLAAFADALR